MDRTLIILVLLVTFLQIIHCFEEIGMNMYVIYKKKNPQNPRGLYLRAASVLVGINFLILALLIFEVKYAAYLCFYTVFVSVVNSFSHIYGYFKTKTYMASLGSGVFSGIPLGICGVLLLIQLIHPIF
ncbi:hypothetical protein HMPREF1982_02978 [Clostridiales bacterium oral taxon 876 str. F0540]|nr:hypothetical protein HMPREF1982_02978 [Clostridiales bacterium oral taxon 876 str. F0540]